MSYKKLLNQYTPEELTESFVFPGKLALKQQKEANRELTEARVKSQAAMTDGQKLYAGLLQLRCQLEDYLKGDQYDPTLTFGYFPERYLQLNHKKNKEFAKKILAAYLLACGQHAPSAQKVDS